MRQELKKLHKVRARFRATVVRFGSKKAYKGPDLITLLVHDVYITKTNQLMADHLWFTIGKTFDDLKLKPGDIIEFDARVTQYKKGYRGRRDDGDYYDDRPAPSIDYRLSFPTKVRCVPATPANLDETLARPVGPMPTNQASLFQ